MEAPTEPAKHNNTEFQNYVKCQRAIRRWTEGSHLPSSYVIRSLHATLMEDSSEYGGKGLQKRSPGDFRKEDVGTSGKPANFYVKGTDVEPVMRKYCEDLDNVLVSTPRSPSGNIEEIIRFASWAYYTFGRIHSFLDGNGRTGRMILKRVIKGAGLKDIVYQDERWEGKKKSSHLDALNAVDLSGDLSHIELYILNSLRRVYQGDNNSALLDEINRTIAKKQADIETSSKRMPLKQLWRGFEGLDIADEISKPQE